MRGAAIAILLAFRALSAFPQSAADPPQFDVADIHPSGPAMNPFTLVSGGVLRGDRYDLRKATMLDLIRIAWKVSPETIFGGPGWLEFDRFDIAAKAPASSSPETVRRMLQSLLIERFHLAVHNDVRPMPAYVLSVGKQKGKMKESSGAGEPRCIYIQQPAGSNVEARSCRNMTMSDFAARYLREIAWQYLKVPVTDATGLEGAWDFDVRWTRRSAVLAEGVERTTLFDALDRQLGLSLVLREAPAPVLVIDRVDKPTPNSPDIAQKLPLRARAFDVATLRLDKTGRPAHADYNRGGIEASSVPLWEWIGFAWDISTLHTTERILGLPRGIESVRIAFNGRTEERANGPAVQDLSGFDDDMRAMLRALFVERFQIKWHYEDRPMDAYSLVPARSKLKKADPSNRASCHEARSLAGDPRDANPLLSQSISCRNVTLAQFASKLQQIDDNRFAYPVEDATGIKGAWDFDLSFTPRSVLDQSSAASGPNGALSLAEAISKQLGLRLEKRKRILPVVVVDHMELTPLDN